MLNVQQTGYSSTPLARKLGLKEGMHVYTYNAPEHYFTLFSDYPKTVIQLDNPKQRQVDLIQVFFDTVALLESELPRLKSYLKSNGCVWCSWPKKTSALAQDLNRDNLRSIGLSAGLVDIKVCAIDQDWSALKFVIPVKDRQR